MGVERSFEPVPGARHRVELRDGVECIVIPMRPHWFVLPFAAVWLIGWTCGGIAMLDQLVSSPRLARLGVFALFFVPWTLGWVYAAGSLLWQTGGQHRLAVYRGELVYRWWMPLFSGTRRYDATLVRNLASVDSRGPSFHGGLFPQAKAPFEPLPVGTITFDYDGRTIRLVPGLDEAEGRVIVERLAAKLPRGAVRG